MKKSTKRFCLKLAAGILSTTLVASMSLPMNVLAVSDTTEHPTESSTIDSSSTNYSENIVREVEEERDEFSKTFLMADGTYYTYVSPVAIHEFIEDKWVNIDDSLSETPSTISQAENTARNYIEEITFATNQISTYSLSEQNEPITVTCIGNSTQTETGYTLSANSALVIKPVTITKYSMANKVLLSATLSVDINSNSINNSRPLYVKHITSEVTSSTTYTNISDYSNIYYKRYDKTITTYSFDITDMYSKWERGNATNNGVALIGPELRGTPLQISVPILSIRCKDVSSNDSSFTYHTLDLGKAGTLSINDVTNAFKIEQTIAGLDCSLLPVTLVRTIDSTKFSLDSYANVSSEWNYNYGLSIAGPYATLTLPQGTKVDFKQPQNATTINNYQIWEQVTNKDYVDGATFHVTQAALDATTVGDIYQDCYVDINGIEYWFNSLGRIEYIKKANKQLHIEYEYFSDLDQFVISKLTDAMGNQYCISYDSYTVNNANYIYANKIEVKDINNAAVMFGDNPLVVNVSNIVEDSMIKSTFTYPSEIEQPITVTYGYDFNGKLLGIESADGTITQLHYKSADNMYLTGYTQTKNNEVINNFTISSNNTFERVFDGTLINKETQRYDSNFQLITYYYGNNIVSMSYENGEIDSYAVNNLGYDESHNIVDNGDFSKPLVESEWFAYSTSLPEKSTDDKIIINNTIAGASIGLSQFIESLAPDTTYIFSGEVEVEESIPSDDYSFNTIIDIFSKDGNIVKSYTLPFDVTLLNETQTRMCAFKTDIECDVMISIYADGNIGSFYVDNIRLYEATPEDGAVAIPTILTSDSISQTFNEDGLVINEAISNETHSLVQEYEYAEDTAKIITTTDFNGVKTFFDYGGRNSKLTQKGYVLKPDGTIENPIAYSYNGVGLLSSVEQIINNTEPTSVTHLAKYNYDSAEHITSVTNNNYSYVFTYDDIGNIVNVKKEHVVGNETDTNNLIDYNYINNNIGSIEYSNGYKLEYVYSEDTGKIIEIVCLKKSLSNNEFECISSYLYTYVDDSISEILINYTDLSYDIKIVYTATGMVIYHIENNVSTAVYSKSETTSNTVEKYLSSATGNNELETFTKTKTTQTSLGTTTELYSEFSGSKVSSLLDNTKNTFSGSNTVIKDFFGRTEEKYFTLENINSSVSTNTTVQTDELSLLQHYNYYNLTSNETGASSLLKTSNLVSRIENIAYSESTTADGTTTNGETISYDYIYDNKGNIRFVYRKISGDNYVLENYYEYDESNQIIVSLDLNEFVFYKYDNDGNIIEKQKGGEFTCIGSNNVNFDTLYEISTSTWDSINWTAYLSLSFAPKKPATIVSYTYDTFGRLSHYTEQNCEYDSQGNLLTNLPTPIIDVEINFDSFGNPLKYIGESPTTNGTVLADLTWNGNQLESALIYDGSTPVQKITFKYDENGYRINKTVYECSIDEENKIICVQLQQINYVWENGTLLGMRVAYADQNSHNYMYTNILYDNTGMPYGITTPTGLAYYFLKDASNNIKGLVDSEGKIVAYMLYDAFGNFEMDITGDSIGDAIIHGFSVLNNPCTYKGYLYDYELGMYFIQNKCYSPTLGRFLNETSFETLTKSKDEPLDINLHLFCKNNPVNKFDKNAEWNQEKFTFISGQTHSIQVEMSKAFLSRPFCTLYASKIISDSGSWDYLNGRNLKNMSIERIASNLFARCVGNYAESAVNRVNATWGDGWIVSNRNSEFIIITETDPNADKYLKIWLAAPSIKSFAALSGIYITL